MSWPQWSMGGIPNVNSATQGLPVLTPSGAGVLPPNAQYTPEQWTQMQQQNWQQWAQWQQQYQQWHQQYGAEFQKSLTAMTPPQTATSLPLTQILPNTSVPPPLPNQPVVESKPPLPPEDAPQNIWQPPKPVSNYSTVLSNQPNNYNTTKEPPPNNWNKNNNNWQNQNNQRNQKPFVGNRNNNFTSPNPNKMNYNNETQDSSNKRPLIAPIDRNDNKRNRFETPLIKKPLENSQECASDLVKTSTLTTAASTTTSATSKEEMSEAEKKFMKQFSDWESQFAKWKEQNQNHPDKAQYREYEKKWEAWRTQLLERREQMKKKRLVKTNVQKDNSCAKIGSNENSLSNINSHLETQFPSFNKPPPNMNSLNLDLNSQNNEKPKQENVETGFLLSSAPKGEIPGLDLVKEDNAENKEEVKKRSNMEAISKGIVTILSDQKIMNMLSLVSQNQQVTATKSIDTTSVLNQPIIASNSGDSFSANDMQTGTFDDYSNHSDMNYNTNDNFNNMDEQTRTSFGGQYDRDFKSPFSNFDHNIRKDDYNKSDNISNDMHMSDNFKDNKFQRNYSYNENQQLDLARKNDFDRPTNVNHAPFDNFGRPDNPNLTQFNRPPPNQYSGPQNSFNSISNRNMEPFNRIIDNTPKGPGHFNSAMSGGGRQFDNFNRDTDNNNRGIDPLNKNTNFHNNRGPENFNRNSDMFKGGPNVNRGADMFNRGPDNFNRDPDGGNRGPDGFNRGPDVFNRGQDNFNRDPDSGTITSIGSDGFIRGPDAFNRGSDTFNRGPDAFKRGPDTFKRGPDNCNRGPDGFNKIPSLFDIVPENFENLADRNMGNSNSFPQKDNFNYDRYSDTASNQDGGRKVDDGGRFLNNRDFRYNDEKSVTYPSDADSFSVDKRSVASLENSKEDISKTMSFSEDIWKPTNVIDYDHKPAKTEEFDIIIETFYTFDYHHKPVNRIPYPERPKWLDNILSRFREFEPQIKRVYERYPERYDRHLVHETYRRYDYYPEERYSKYPRGEYDSRLSLDLNRFNSNRYQDEHYEKKSPIEKYSTNKISSITNDRKGFENMVPGRKSPIYDKDKHRILNVDNLSPRDLKNEQFNENEKSNYDTKFKTEKQYERKEQDKFEDSESFSYKPNFSFNSKENVKKNITLIEDILNPPERYNRPPRIVIILRGPPGSGKTFLAKLIKDREVENGGSPPRILSLDDYFMVELEKEVEEDGRMVKVKEMVYEFEEAMESSYKSSLLKSFKKTVTDGYFPFIVVDNINDKVKYFSDMWSFAKQNGFQVYVCQLELDVQMCTKRNSHNRSEVEIEQCVAGWEQTPSHYSMLDATSLIQAGSIREVEMEEINSPQNDYDSDTNNEDQVRSKWDAFDCSQDNLAKLDGINKPLRSSRTMEDYLQLEDELFTKVAEPGKKRVRWADLEERKEQEKMRAIGFVVGQTNWNRMMDPTHGSSALTQTKYIERVRKY